MSEPHDELIAVRKGEELPLQLLIPFLREHLPDVQNEEIVVEQFASGHSNLTYLIRAGEFEAVLRRPPLGPVAAKAHDMGREFNVLQAVHPSFPLAPKPYLFCDSPDIIGAPFQVMERRHGLVIDRDWPSAYPQTREVAKAVSLSTVHTLAELHQVDYRETPLVQLGHPEGYLERQVTGWLGRYEKAKTEEIQAAVELKERLTSSIPNSPKATIVHNDLKLNNMLLSKEHVGEVSAVVDWEMATVGDPLTDLATTLSYWAQAGDPPLLLRWLGNLGNQPGMLNRDDLIQAYTTKTGVPVDNIAYYMMFAYFKVAVICQQIYYRYVRGQTQDERFATLGAVARGLIEYAIETGGR